MNNATWSLEPCDILYSDKRLMIDQFTLHHGDEHLIIDGLASTNASDSLLLDLNGIDVAYLLELVNFHAVQFDGKVDHTASLHQTVGRRICPSTSDIDTYRTTSPHNLIAIY